MEVRICIGSSCHLKGSKPVVDTIQRLVIENGLFDRISLKGSFCMGRCSEGVCVTVDGRFYSVTPETAEEFFEKEILAKIA